MKYFLSTHYLLKITRLNSFNKKSLTLVIASVFFLAQKKEELKINGVTLIVIENGKNVNYIEGSDNIITFINK